MSDALLGIKFIESQYNGARMPVPTMASQDSTGEWQKNMTENLLKTGGGNMFKPVASLSDAKMSFGIPDSPHITFSADAKKAAKADNLARARAAKAEKANAVAA
jgi:hypothetical protein